MVKAISNSFAVNNNVQTVRQRTVDDGKKGFVIGAVAGGIEGFSRKSWLNNKDNPGDSFVKEVSKNLEKSLKPEEHIELDKVKNFFAALTDSKTPMSDFRARIEASTELTNALPTKEGETANDTLNRIFSYPKKSDIRNELRNLQDRTVVDKRVNTNTAKKLINANYDKANKTLKQAQSTSKEMFGLIKKSARKIKVNTAMAHTVIGGVLVGTLGLLIGATAVDTTKK